MTNNHVPVLSQEIISVLNFKNLNTFVDCTLGRGGHSMLLLEKMSQNSQLFAFDKDFDAILYCKNKFSKEKRIKIIHDDFLNMENYIKKQVDFIIMDLGVSSPQLDNVNRGFSYHNNAKLDMRMNQNAKLDAKKIVNTYKLQDLIFILKTYGEEKYAKSIAQEIIKVREKNIIETTYELVSIIKNSTPKKYRFKKHPARKTFQALRIEVNNELETLKQALNKAIKLLKKNGILAIITFHSLEDRIVKKFFKKLTSPTKTSKEIPIIDIDDRKFLAITKKPITPSIKEIEQNNRARSAKLRMIKKWG